MRGNLVPSPSHGLVYRPAKRSKHKMRFVAVMIVLAVELGLAFASPQLVPILLFTDVVIVVLLIARAVKTRRH